MSMLPMMKKQKKCIILKKCSKSFKIGTRIGVLRNIEIVKSAYFKAFSRRYIEK